MENGKNRKTKAELAFRERGEAALLTGVPIIESDEIKANISAHKAFVRLIDRMDQIKKNDELYGEGARRYCLNIAKLERLNETIEKMRAKAEEIEDPTEYNKAQGDILRQEQFAQRVQDSLSKFENENGMNVAASLRMIPKKPEQAKNPILEALSV